MDSNIEAENVERMKSGEEDGLILYSKRFQRQQIPSDRWPQRGSRGQGARTEIVIRSRRFSSIQMLRQVCRNLRLRQFRRLCSSVMPDAFGQGLGCDTQGGITLG